jgi:hypothetical protein
MTDEGLRLEHADGRPSPAKLDDVNDAFAKYGSRVWPLDLSDVPREQRRLLDARALSADDTEDLLEHFLLPREQLLALIAAAGREPNVPRGGEMHTLDATHDVPYPELYLVAPGADYSRFDRLHVNRATDGTGVDETLQMLSGRGVRIVQSRPGVGSITLHLDCPSPDRGWTVTYPGSRPHIASFTSASEGCKVLMQIIGPPVWNMEYVDAETS